MEKKVIIDRISHKGEWRYGIRFPIDKTLSDLVRNMTGATWSNTLKCWHLPGNEDALKEVIARFKGVADVDISSLVGIEEQRRKSAPPPPDDKETDSPDAVPESDDPFLHFSSSDEIPVHRKDLKKPGSVRFSINESDGMLVIRFPGKYDQEWIEELRSYGNLHYDRFTKCFTLSWSQITVDSLADYFAGRGVKVEVRKFDNSVIKEIRIDKGKEIKERELVRKVAEGIERLKRYLNEKRYSRNTSDTYLSLIEVFFRYFSPAEPEDITPADITGFFNDYIMVHNYSASYQNQMVSAIKMYYLINCPGRDEVFSISRPRKSRALPKVFSKEEVKEILNSPRNDKHRLILWLIYSCGLRRSEVINIKLVDLDRKRGILNIMRSKGMTDRIVPVPEKVWVKVDLYLESYRPKVYLFEGQGGGRYSSESVYRIFKEALRRTGIKRDVGVHCLRHSYATHLHENGLDIRYIQELLGHKSTRTTEIYTHVSRRNLAAIRSPIEDMDVR